MQYRRAVQLYYRKFHAYPPNVDALVKTNEIRFLRKKYIDPMTGKADWKPVLYGQNKTPTAMGFFGQPLSGNATTIAGVGPSGGNGLDVWWFKPRPDQVRPWAALPSSPRRTMAAARHPRPEALAALRAQPAATAGTQEPRGRQVRGAVHRAERAATQEPRERQVRGALIGRNEREHKRHAELGNQFIGKHRLGNRLWPDRTDLWRRGHHRLFPRQPKTVHPGLQEEKSL